MNTMYTSESLIQQLDGVLQRLQKRTDPLRHLQVIPSPHPLSQRLQEIADRQPRRGKPLWVFLSPWRIDPMVKPLIQRFHQDAQADDMLVLVLPAHPFFTPGFLQPDLQPRLYSWKFFLPARNSPRIPYLFLSIQARPGKVRLLAGAKRWITASEWHRLPPFLSLNATYIRQRQQREVALGGLLEVQPGVPGHIYLGSDGPDPLLPAVGDLEMLVQTAAQRFTDLRTWSPSFQLPHIVVTDVPYRQGRPHLRAYFDKRPRAWLGGLHLFPRHLPLKLEVITAYLNSPRAQEWLDTITPGLNRLTPSLLRQMPIPWEVLHQAQL